MEDEEELLALLDAEFARAILAELTTLEDVTVTFADGTYDVAVTRSSSNPADRFTELFEGLS